MASIVYSLCGEGRGHATRARATVEAMRGRHRVTIFAAHCAYEMLAPIYERDRARDGGRDEVRVVRIPGLQFGYTRGGRVDLLRTLRMAASFRMAVEAHVDAVMPELRRSRPDLVISDFEPIIPRAALRCGLPFVSFDHQHYLAVSDLSSLPFRLRQEARLAAPFVRALYDWQAATIVSSFYRAPLKPAHRDAVWVGTLMRPSMLGIVPQPGNHVVAYIRRHASAETMAALAACGREVRIYGLGERPAEGPLGFRAIDERRFLDDLATCDAVVSTAGNQLVGEALYLRKPVLAMPEPWNFEQSVNAYFLEQSGAGWAERGTLTPERLGAFLAAAGEMRAHIRPELVCGNDAALAALERHIETPRPPLQAPSSARPGSRGAVRRLPATPAPAARSISAEQGA